VKYCLVTPRKDDLFGGKRENPGWDLITSGIQFIISKNDQSAEFSFHDMFSEEININADRIVICGNPRFDLDTKGGNWLYEGLFSELKKLGIPILDAWAGTGVPLGEVKFSEIVKNKRNINIARSLKKSNCIARDNLTKRIFDFFRINSVLLPCSSFFAKDFFGIHQHKPRSGIFRKVFISYCMTGYEGGKELIEKYSETHEVVSTNTLDYEYCQSIGIASRLISDHVSLLELYSHCAEVVSLRLHAAIPAASLGAKVHLFAVDSRAEACDLFNISYSDYRVDEINFKKTHTIAIPDIRKILAC
jgi:hypothetical protein